jgi:hypothetical protein
LPSGQLRLFSSLFFRIAIHPFDANAP